LAWPPFFAALAALASLAGACGGPPFASGSDAGLTDGPSFADAVADADAGPPDGLASDGSDADAGLPFCANAGAHSFCEDFDTDAGVPGKFTPLTSSSVAVGNGSKIVTDPSTFVSSPNSALAQTPALLRPSGDQATALLGATIAAASTTSPATRLKWSAELQIASGCVANTDGALVALVTTGAYGLALSVLPAQTELVELNFTNDGGVANSTVHGFPAVLTEPHWLAVGIELDLRVKTATVTVDGTAVLDTAMLTLSPPSSATSASLLLGAQVSDVKAISPGCRVHVDNVLFDVL
jgi:hypothetical protein